MIHSTPRRVPSREVADGTPVRFHPDTGILRTALVDTREEPLGGDAMAQTLEQLHMVESAMRIARLSALGHVAHRRTPFGTFACSSKLLKRSQSSQTTLMLSTLEG